MAEKIRPPLITELTVARRSKARNLNRLTRRIEKYCGQATSETLSRASPEGLEEGVTRGLRSQVTKELFVLEVVDCIECNRRVIEAFQHEVKAFEKKRPLFCHHKRVIGRITALGTEREDDLAPAISIPAQEVTIGRQSTKPVESIASTASSITTEKLEKSREELKAGFEEWEKAHEDLEHALEYVQDGEITGFKSLYSKEAMEEYVTEFTDKYEDANEVAKVKIEELKRLCDFD